MTALSGTHELHPPSISSYFCRESEATHVLDERRVQEEQRWKSLPLTDKISDWVLRHQYPVILGGWALSLGVAGAVISRQR